MNIHFSKSAGNTKTGPMLVTTQSSDTCPKSCPHYGKGCYARFQHLGGHWKRVDDGRRAKNWDDFIAAIGAQQPGSLWRLSQAGDLPGENETIDEGKLNEIITANRRYRGFTFTHKPLTDVNKRLIADANTRGFTINLSADSLTEADEFIDHGIAPVVVTMPTDPDQWAKTTPAGNKIVICPNVTKKLTCVQCGLCQKANRKSIVGFPAHGPGKKLVQSQFDD